MPRGWTHVHPGGGGWCGPLTLSVQSISKKAPDIEAKIPMQKCEPISQGRRKI